MMLTQKELDEIRDLDLRRNSRHLLAHIDALAARLAEAIECCTIKDNRNMWLEIRLKKIMARCADLLDEDQFNEIDAIARAECSQRATESPESQEIVAHGLHSASVSASGGAK